MKTKNSQNHTISGLNVFMCFCFNQSRGRRQDAEEDEGSGCRWAEAGCPFGTELLSAGGFLITVRAR